MISDSYKNNNNSNNNDTNNIIGNRKVLIPIYIQKKIYKYLIIMELNKSDHDSYEINAKMIKKFSLLSWEWFNFISSKIYHTLILTDYNKLQPMRTKDNDNRFLLKKPESIKYLKLVHLSKLDVDKVNETLKSLVNLKWITSEHNNTKFETINFKQFRVNSMILCRYENTIYSSYIKRVDYLYIEYNTPAKNIINAFETSKIYGFDLDLKQNYAQFNITRFPWKELRYSEVIKDVKNKLGGDDDDDRIVETENRLQWCRDVKFCVLNVKMLNEFLKSTPKLRNLTIGICFLNLIYKLYRRYTSNYDEDEPKALKPCDCSKSFENCSKENENSRIGGYDDLFSVYYDEICDLLSNHKYLTRLSITDRCFSDKNLKFDGIESITSPITNPEKTTLEQNQHFFQSFANIFSNNKSIKTLVIHASDFIKLDFEIIFNNTNSTIDTYHFSYHSCHNKKYQSKTLDRVSEYFKNSPNNIIKSFKITNHYDVNFEYQRDVPKRFTRI
ncbi:hypothetical protein RB653_007767 [Dictyostelium firmibasis]|uniref:Uncharacterized protein n=1 Tax=Dictyostelium firmibasis TaxID=79012 RepID=A0AAN7TW65_9MYCE